MKWVAFCAVALAGCGSNRPGTTEPTGPVPDSYRVVFETSKGNFTVEVTKAWAPEGAERFYRLVQQRFYDGARFFRVVPDFVVQFGINGDPAVESRWRGMTIADDPVKQSNVRGSITFATSGPNSRTTQVFINLKDNTRLDGMGFAPLGRVADGMESVVDHLYWAYSEGPPHGNGPDQTKIEQQGNAYLERDFPRLDYIRRARIAGSAGPQK